MLAFLETPIGVGSSTLHGPLNTFQKRHNRRGLCQHRYGRVGDSHARGRVHHNWYATGDKDVAQALRRLIAESEVDHRAIERLSVREEEGFIDGPRDYNRCARVFEGGGYISMEIRGSSSTTRMVELVRLECRMSRALARLSANTFRQRRLLGEP